MLRIMHVGLSHDHAWWMLEHLFDTNGCALVAVVGESEYLLQKATKRYELDARMCYRDIDVAVRETRPDAAIITSPNNEHVRIVEACARHGVNCLVQKPLATNYADAKKIEHFVQSSGIRIMVNCFPLWNPVVRLVLDRARAGMVGAVHKMIVHHGHQGPVGLGFLTPEYLGWIYDPVRHGGGVLMDQASYGICYAADILGAPLGVFARGFTLKPEESGSVEDDSLVILDYPRATATIHGSNAWPFGRREIHVFGEKGGIRSTDTRTEFEHRYRSDAPQRKIVERLEPDKVPKERENGIRHFVHCLENESEFDRNQSLDLNLLVAATVEAAYKSISENRYALLDEIIPR